MKKNWLLIVICVVLLIAVFFSWRLFSYYSSVFGGDFPASVTRSEWGAMGDFFGGMLNPFFFNSRVSNVAGDSLSKSKRA